MDDFLGGCLKSISVKATTRRINESGIISVVYKGCSMSQFGFYMAGVGVAGGGRAGLLLAWDPDDQGSSAVDNIDFGQIGLYSWMGPLPVISPATFKMRSKSPIAIPSEGCPLTLDGAPDRDFFIRFGVKPGGSSASPVNDGWLEIFEGNTRIYGIAPQSATIKVELAEGSVAVGLSEYSMQDRVIFAALEDPLEGWAVLMGGLTTPAKEIWRDLMTPNSILNWSPV
jgi:hypothetical protein